MVICLCGWLEGGSVRIFLSILALKISLQNMLHPLTYTLDMHLIVPFSTYSLRFLFTGVEMFLRISFIFEVDVLAGRLKSEVQCKSSRETAPYGVYPQVP